jgi:hypothetical protein
MVPSRYTLFAYSSCMRTDPIWKTRTFSSCEKTRAAGDDGLASFLPGKKCAHKNKLRGEFAAGGQYIRFDER